MRIEEMIRKALLTVLPAVEPEGYDGEEPEYLTGHAVDALLLPVDEITAETAAELIPSLQTPVLVYCRSGRRSRRAARLLDALGYENLYDMGGLVGWPYGLE